MCPNCRAFITTSDRVCPYCNAEVGPRAVDRRNPGEILGGLIPQARFTTVLILILNTALFAATSLYSMQTGTQQGGALQLFGASMPMVMLQGQWWRLITAGFLHAGIMHILMNSWVLFDLGAEVEMIYGTSRFIVFYFVSTVCGFFLSSFTGHFSVGSSAGIFGLIGAMIAFGVTDKSALGSYAKALYIRWAIYGLVIGLLPFFPIDNAAHIGGIISGFIVAFIIRTPSVRGAWKDPILRGLAGVCIVLTALAFARMLLGVAGN